MPDFYAAITEVDPEILEILVGALELRAADPQQVAMRERYFSWMNIKPEARVLEVGCGTGPVAEHLTRIATNGEVLGVDPSPHFIEKAREMRGDIPNLRFEEGDAQSLPFDDASFDTVIFHTCLCHLPSAEAAIAEAHRVLCPGGKLGVFDGDYSTTTVAIGEHDPLQQCADAAMSAYVHDRWFVRKAPRLIRSAGFRVQRLDSHSYLQSTEPSYMLTLVDRGADTLVGTGHIDDAMAASLKSEARRRADAGEFFGFIGFASLIAERPA